MKLKRLIDLAPSMLFGALLVILASCAKHEAPPSPAVDSGKISNQGKNKRYVNNTLNYYACPNGPTPTSVTITPIDAGGTPGTPQPFQLDRVGYQSFNIHGTSPTGYLVQLCDSGAKLIAAFTFHQTRLRSAFMQDGAGNVTDYEIRWNPATNVIVIMDSETETLQ